MIDRQGISIHRQGYSNVIIIFGGVYHGLGIPVFEYFNSTQEIESDKLFFRDLRQAWYQFGVDDQNLNSLNAVEDYLRDLLNEGGTSPSYS